MTEQGKLINVEMIPGLRVLAEKEKEVRNKPSNGELNQQPVAQLLEPSLPPTLDRRERRPYFVR